MLKKFQLRNGLTVLFYPTKRSPVVSVQAWVRTGSADEIADEKGISHFIEHMLFKGTEKYKVGEIASLVEASGGQLNAYTSFDQTVYYVTISKDYINEGLDVVSQMVTAPIFDPEEIENEKEVVVEEIKRSTDSPSRESLQHLLGCLYQKHPYGIPVIGYEKNVRNFSKLDVSAYFEERYSPNNMTVVIVGDFEPKNTKEKIQNIFGKLKKNKLKIRKRPIEKNREGYVVDIKKSSFNESFFNIAWQVPEANHKDIPALDLLSMIMGQFQTSRLIKSLVMTEPVAKAVSTFNYSLKDSGIFVITSTLNNEKLSSFLDRLGEEILKIQFNTPDLIELEKSLISLESDQFSSLETVDGLAREIGTYENLFYDPNYHIKFLKKANSLTPIEISKVAQKYLNPKNLVATYMTKSELSESRELVEKFVTDLNKAYEILINSKYKKLDEIKMVRKKANLPAIKSESVGRKIEEYTCKSGLKLIMRPSNDIPLISTNMAFLGGMRSAPIDKDGIVELTANMFGTGTNKLDEDEILSRLEGMASSINGFGGRNSLGVSMSTLSNFEKPVSKLLVEMIKEPVFSKKIFDRELELLKQELSSQLDSPSFLAINNFYKGMFWGHPYSRETGGTETSLQNLKILDVSNYWSQTAKASNLVVSISGRFDKSLWIDHVEEISSHLEKGFKFKKDFSLEPLNSSRFLYLNSMKEQAHLVIGFRGLTFTSKEKFALVVLESILAGQGGRLFLNLRDKASLAYSIAPIRMEGIDTGYFAVYIGCSPEKVSKAKAMILEEFEKLMNEPVGEVELERAKRYLIGRHDIGLQRNASITYHLLFDELYGVNYKEIFNYGSIVNSVTSSQIKNLAQQIFTQSAVYSLVGPENSWNDTELFQIDTNQQEIYRP